MFATYGVHIEEDAKKQAVINRRQKVEAERKIRILDDRVRTAGKDLSALKRQVLEKYSNEEFQKQRDRQYVQYSQNSTTIAREFDKRIEHDKLQFKKEMQKYQQTFQRFKDRREYDLNRTDNLKVSYPARLSDNDPRLSSCGGQIFEGEDLSYKERMRKQALESKSWLNAQLEEKQRCEEEWKKAEDAYNQRIRNSSLRTFHLINAEKYAQRAVNKARADFNLVLAHETAERNEIIKQAEDEAEVAHKLNMSNSELLTETVDSTSMNGPHRTLIDRFKGFSPARLADIREHQIAQATEKKKLLSEENLREKTLQRRVNDLDIYCQMRDRSLHQQKREKLAECKVTNSALCREQQLRENYRNRILYTQIPSDDFFSQFQTTSR